MVAIDIGLHMLIHAGFKDCDLVFLSDNQGIVGAFSWIS